MRHVDHLYHTAVSEHKCQDCLNLSPKGKHKRTHHAVFSIRIAQALPAGYRQRGAIRHLYNVMQIFQSSPTAYIKSRFSAVRVRRSSLLCPPLKEPCLASRTRILVSSSRHDYLSKQPTCRGCNNTCSLVFQCGCCDSLDTRQPCAPIVEATSSVLPSLGRLSRIACDLVKIL